MPCSPEKALRSVLDPPFGSEDLSCPDGLNQAGNADKGDGSFDVVGDADLRPTSHGPGIRIGQRDLVLTGLVQLVQQQSRPVHTEEIGDGAEVRLQVPQQPDHLDIAMGLGLKQFRRIAAG